MSPPLEALLWPRSRAGEGLGALCRHAGLGADREPLAPGAKETLARWIARAAAGLEVEAEEIEAPHRDAEAMLAAAGPALLRVSGSDEGELLVLLGSRAAALEVLLPDGSVARVDRDDVRTALCREAEDEVAPDVARVIARAGIPARRLARTRSALQRALLADARVGGGWLIRASPASGWRSQARELGLPRLLAALLGAHAIQYGLWLLSWWLLGGIVLQGRLETDWLLAWGLLLLTLVPFRVLVTSMGGRLAVRAGALVKRRLLFGALGLEVDSVRRRGAGQLLGRVLESEVLDAMALSGGFLALTALLELVLAGVVLGLGAGGALHVVLLVAALAAVAWLAWRHLERRRRWTALRLDMTDDLVERMGGHRTRLAQEPRERWNREEDQALARYLGQSVVLDGSVVGLQTLLPRLWLIVALLGLGPAFVWGDPTSGSLAVAIGGVLLAHGAFRSLGDGVEELAASAIAWERAQLLWRTEGTRSAAASTAPPPTSIAERPAPGTALIDARELVFRYPHRNEGVLQGADLTVQAGDQILLLGASGGGKSTLGAVLAAARTADAGLLLYQGLDRATLGDVGWRQRVVLVPQFHENHVLQGSLAFNLLFGRRWPPGPEDVEAAGAVCEALGLGPLLERMPGGLQQMVGETGWQLSHGERSRIFLARALLQDPSLLILDESLGTLDPDALRTTLEQVLARSPSLVVIEHP